MSVPPKQQLEAGEAAFVAGDRAVEERAGGDVGGGELAEAGLALPPAPASPHAFVRAADRPPHVARAPAADGIDRHRPDDNHGKDGDELRGFHGALLCPVPRAPGRARIQPTPGRPPKQAAVLPTPLWAFSSRKV